MQLEKSEWWFPTGNISKLPKSERNVSVLVFQVVMWLCAYKTHAAIHRIVGIVFHVSHIIYTDYENFLKTNLQITLNHCTRKIPLETDT